MKTARILCFAAILSGLAACQSPSRSGEALDSSPLKTDVRHGWTVFTGPKPTQTKSTNTESIERGRAVFAKYCQSCHGVTGQGNGPDAQEFRLHPANLKNVAKALPNHYIFIQINEGKSGGMPRWKDLLTSQDAADVTQYIQSLSK
ncbi:MAG: cytochrome c [Oligoflexia bacterium]|nr:cytochrome c [Oligoflexia bacterium]